MWVFPGRKFHDRSGFSPSELFPRSRCARLIRTSPGRASRRASFALKDRTVYGCRCKITEKPGEEPDLVKNQKLVTYMGRNVVREGGGRRGREEGGGLRPQGVGGGGLGSGKGGGGQGSGKGGLGRGGPEYANTPRTGACKYPVGNSYV